MLYPICYETPDAVRTAKQKSAIGHLAMGTTIKRERLHLICHRVIIDILQCMGIIHCERQHRIIGRYPDFSPIIFHNISDSLILNSRERIDRYKSILFAIIIRKSAPHRACPYLLTGIDQQAEDILHIPLLSYRIPPARLILQIQTDNSLIIGSNPDMVFRVFLDIKNTRAKKVQLHSGHPVR